MCLTELSCRNLVHTSTERPPPAAQGTSGSTIVVLTRAERWVRTVDRWRQYASPGEEQVQVITLTSDNQEIIPQSLELTSVESTGDDLVLHGITQQL